MRPLIGVTGEGEPSLGEGWYGVREAYMEALWKAGGFPILLPPDHEAAQEAASRLDGLLLTGGWDVEPSLYGEEKHPNTDGISLRRDHTEIALIREFSTLGKPILGICRGIQILAVAFGGSLIQELSKHPCVVINHSSRPLRHAVRLASDSLLQAIYGQDSIMANSTHHQAVGRIPDGFKSTAYSLDGVIEGMERGNILAVQWHPERLANEGHLCIFEHLVMSAR